tara:strand:+ start:828 stop:1175 length:348 start_codon:yes stop_codon:yes gene_type:complete
MDGEIIDLDHSEARGKFLKSLKKTYSRRPKGQRPKTTKERFKRAGGLIPGVALAKAAGAGRKRRKGSVSRRRPENQEKIEGRPKRGLGRRAMQKAKARQSAKPSVVNAHTYFKNR